MKKGKGTKSELIFGIIGTIVSIVSIIMVITDPKTLTYLDFFRRTWITIFMYVFFILPVLTSGISAFLSNNKY